MADGGKVAWDTCTEDHCVGARLPTSGRCWAHADGQDLDEALKRLGEDGQLDARGMVITADLLKRILAAAPRDEADRPTLKRADFRRTVFDGLAVFSGATFKEVARFDEATFKGGAGFGEATFSGGAGFDRATFKGMAVFDRATFKGGAVFGEAAFEGEAGFGRATFEDAAWFGRATFKEAAGFGGTTFKGAARFGRVTFKGGAWFGGTTFKGGAWFVGAVFNGEADFGGATFRRDARLDEATFDRARELGPMLVRKHLVLDGAVFHQRAQIQVSAAALRCRRARFLDGVVLRVRWAEVVLGLSDLAAPSVLTDARPFPGLEEGRWARALQRLRGPGLRGSRPRLLAVRRADVAGLTVSNVDLRACRFFGAHHLDRLRIEECDFPMAPRGWWWTTRQTIAEEHQWRATRPSPTIASPTGHGTAASAARRHQTRRTAGWHGPVHRAPAWLASIPVAPGQAAMGPETPLSAAEIAGLYRALRKGREDSKDEPGAADFYYGEMEMRRQAKRAQIRRERRPGHRGTAIAAAAEYGILWLYWLVSGYGLRAWRALATLGVVVGLAGLVFSQAGFHDPRPSLLVSWLYALQATVSLEAKARELSVQLTLPGELLRVGLRFAGPVLLGLAVLSIRGRVKR